MLYKIGLNGIQIVKIFTDSYFKGLLLYNKLVTKIPCEIYPFYQI